MLSDGRQVPSGTRVDTDVCIVGAGAAGITLARELSAGPMSVVLLESGGLAPDAATHDLNAGEVVGRPYHDLSVCRRRYFGGTTNHWTGWCRPLEAIDFEPRPWIPWSGWPIDLADLVPYYERAQELCDLGPFRYDAGAWPETRLHPPLELKSTEFVTSIFQFSAPTRFGERYRADLADAAQVRVLTHSNVVDIVLRDDGPVVERVDVATLEGGAYSVHARHFVLATGGVENARLLLAATGGRARRGVGLGNDRDLVGRFFIDHPHVGTGALLPVDDAVDVSGYLPRSRHEARVASVLLTSPDLRRRERLLGFSATFTASYTRGQVYDRARESRGARSLDYLLGRSTSTPDADAGIGSHLWNVITDFGNVTRAGYAMVARRPNEAYLVYCRAEQSPNPDSRVSLGEDRDALGVPRARLSWGVRDTDIDSIWRSLEHLGREVGRAGLGRLQLPLGGPSELAESMAGGFHHLGTTRMASGPDRGVVDAHCRVHGHPNLHVAGSSVFPTSGTANPTLTIVALAVRLAERLREVS